MKMSEEEMDAMLNEMIDGIHQDEIDWSHVVQVGDWVPASDDGFFLSGPQYKTKGKLYQVREVDIRTDQTTGKVYSRSVIVDSDYIGEDGKPQRTWLGNGPVIVRDGKVIWESRLQKSVSNLLENRHLEPNATAEDWAKLEEIRYVPDLGTC